MSKNLFDKREEEVNWTDTCMPSWPDIPIPTSAAWIILTSFAPSPRKGRQKWTVKAQERVLNMTMLELKEQTTTTKK